MSIALCIDLGGTEFRSIKNPPLPPIHWGAGEGVALNKDWDLKLFGFLSYLHISSKMSDVVQKLTSILGN